jgi:small subunit ribosomal protein S18
MVYIKREENQGPRNKKCMFCKAKVNELDYKNVTILTRYLNRWNQIESADRSGTCRRHQRELARAIKQARHLALLPFVIK